MVEDEEGRKVRKEFVNLRSLNHLRVLTP
jgi:hypothetical protein